jgi:hypothetical protein
MSSTPDTNDSCALALSERLLCSRCAMGESCNTSLSQASTWLTCILVIGFSSSVDAMIFAEAWLHPGLSSGLTMGGSLMQELDIGSGGNGFLEPISKSAAPKATGEVNPLLIGSGATNGGFSMLLNACRGSPGDSAGNGSLTSKLAWANPRGTVEYLQSVAFMPRVTRCWPIS